MLHYKLTHNENMLTALSSHNSDLETRSAVSFPTFSQKVTQSIFNQTMKLQLFRQDPIQPLTAQSNNENMKVIFVD